MHWELLTPLKLIRQCRQIKVWQKKIYILCLKYNIANVGQNLTDRFKLLKNTSLLP